MAHGDLNWIAGFKWNIADDVLRDVYFRGKYRHDLDSAFYQAAFELLV
jgi:hypothetical protein